MRSPPAFFCLHLFALICFASKVFLPDPALATTPTIFWASDPVKPGQTVQLTGAGLDAVRSVEVTTLSNQPDITVKGVAESAQILAKSPATLSFLLPAKMASGVFSVTLDAGDASLTFQLNAPDVYWTQGDKGFSATPGGWLRLSGRNMALTENAIVKITSSEGKETALPVSAPDSWSAAFPLPESLAIGSYRARLWNGSGDASTWRDVGSIEIEARSRTDLPVMKLYSNHPDNLDHDDTGRINASMGALARRGGGTLFLHAGIYRLTGTLQIPDGVALKGEANDLVTLIWKDTENPPDALMEGIRNFSVADLTINAERHFHIIRGGFDPVSAEPVGTNITVKGVIIRASSFLRHMKNDEPLKRLEAMQNKVRTGVAGLLLGGSNIVVEGCDVLSSMRPLVLVKPVAARVAGNTLRTGRRGWYGISGPDGVIFENNRIIGNDLQASGGGINTFGGSFARNVLVRNNRFETMYGWDREAMTSDGAGGYYRGRLVDVRDASATMDPVGLGTLQEKDWKGAGLFVLKGRGLGLVARVTTRTGNLAVLDRDIAMAIDKDSVVSIVPMQENYLVVGNTFEDAGAAQVFGTGYKHVFADNKSRRSDGLKVFSLDYRHPQPNFYTQFLGNEIAGPTLRRAAEIAVEGRQFEGNETLLTLGVVVRENRLRSAAMIRVDGRSDNDPAIRNVLIEQNEVGFGATAINIGKGVEELIVRDNKIEDVRLP